MALSWTKNISFLVLNVRANRLRRRGREKRRRKGERRKKEEEKQKEKKRYRIYISLEHLLGMEIVWNYHKSLFV